MHACVHVCVYVCVAQMICSYDVNGHLIFEFWIFNVAIYVYGPFQTLNFRLQFVSTTIHQILLG